MITIQQEFARFTYRVAGIALHNDRVLLNRAEEVDWWFIPGGRAEMGETTSETLRREMLEELGADVQVDRLLWVVENFFEFEGVAHHEVGLYFLMRFAPDSPLYEKTEPFAGDEDNARLIFQWHDRSTLAQVALYPEYLRQGLQTLPETTTHVVHRDS
jgi:8-oxo-dGTP pyrophosphatase MutT (NUDIX family)